VATPEKWHFFSIDIEDASFIAWEGGEMLMTRWNRDRGLDQLMLRGSTNYRVQDASGVGA
jgi:hypothetical protein